MDGLIEALKKLNIEPPKYGRIEFIFRDGNCLDIIKEDRIRVISN